MRIEAEGHIAARTLYSHVGYLSAYKLRDAQDQWAQDKAAVMPLMTACVLAVVLGAVAALGGASVLAQRPLLQRVRQRAERRLIYGLLVVGIGLSSWIAAAAWVGRYPAG